MKGNQLSSAGVLLRKKRWSRIIQELEPLETIYRDTGRYFYLLGVAYLYSGDTGAAYRCFRRGRQLDFRDAGLMSGLAAVHVLRGESDKAVQLYIEMLDRDPRSPLARRALNYLRTSKPVDNESLASDTRRLARKIFPEHGVRWRNLLTACLLGSVLIAGVWLLSLLFDGRVLTHQRPGIDQIILTAEDTKAATSTEGAFKLILSTQQTVELFEKAKKLFDTYRDEAALVEINRLLASNASPAIKAKARLLAQFVREPSFLSLPDRFTLSEVLQSPYLYQGVAVAWKGLPANTRTAGSTLEFELLVGYHDGKRLEGIVPVTVPFEFGLLDGQALEVLGTIAYDPEAQTTIRLIASAIHVLPAF